jgi:hypothetical protein
MGNFNNYYFNKIDIFLTNSDYWDLFLCSDERLYSNNLYCNDIVSGSSLVSYFDFNNPECVSGNTIYSLVCWDGSTLPSYTGLSLCDIGLTGVDNGLVQNLTGETLTITSGDCRLHLTRVSGSTYVYPWSIQSGTTGQYLSLCGGFFQGYWKLQGFDYQVLPRRMEWGWTSEFWLNKTEVCVSGVTGTTLNDLYPNNKGFFFYLGARAENKFWNLFSGETGMTTCFSGVSISPEGHVYDPLDNMNPFLRYNGGCNGYSCTCTSSSGCCGTCCSVCTCNSSSAVTIYNKNVENDVIGNNLGLRIKDDGSIGYRLIAYSAQCPNCCNELTGNTSISGISIVENYSVSGMVENNVWTHVAVVFKRNCTSPCIDNEEFPPYPDCKQGRLFFYINGYLKYVVHDFDEVLFKGFDEFKSKVEGVPYNMSLGGGSQGLLESRTFEGPDADDKNLLIEKHFAGTFIGWIQRFRFYNEPLDVTEIRCNYNTEKSIYN